MQTYQQTFASSTTWVMNLTGKYFVTLQATNVVNVRFYKAGSKLDLGDITGLGVGLEVGPLAGLKDEHAFDRIEIDVTGPDTIKVGVGNGAARYNNSLATVVVTTMVPVISSAFAITTPAITTSSTQILAANPARKYLAIQNNDPAVIVYLNFGSTAVAGPGSLKITPGNPFEMSDVQTSQAINMIGSAATSNITVIQG